MKRTMGFCLSALAIFVAQPSLGDDQPAAPKQIQLHVRVCQGDPLGSVEAKTMKIQSQPLVVTLEGRPAQFVSGGEASIKNDGSAVLVPFGTIVNVSPGKIRDGKIWLDVNVSHTEKGISHDERSQFHSESARVVGFVRLKESLKIRLGQGSAQSQKWIELVVTEVGVR
jgi:hypothetical protein